MRVSAKEILGAWVEYEHEAPYHTEQQPIGKDRKSEEGPTETNEDFKNTWMPTEKEQVTCEPAAVEQIEVVTLEVESMRKRSDAQPQPIPGVPFPLFKAWEEAHDAEMDFAGSSDVETLNRFVQLLVEFVREAQRVGLRPNPEHIERLKNFTTTHPPDRGMEYGPATTSDILRQLDRVLGNIHSEVARLTNTEKVAWYEYQANQMKEVKHFNTPVMQLTPEEEIELGIPNRKSPQQLSEQRGLGEPFLDELWRRKKKHELRGMRVQAIDVIRTPKDVNVLEETMPEEKTPQQHPWRPNEPAIAPGTEEEIISMTIGDAGEWEQQDEAESGVTGSIFSYQKSIYLDEAGDGNNLEIYAFVEPLANRKKRLIDQAKNIAGPRLERNPIQLARSQKLMEEANGMPDRGYINDIEIFYQDDLIFHRERSFGPKTALSQREFMAGDSMQRAINDLQEFVRTKIDPVQVGAFIEHALQNPGKGEAKLSHRGDHMHTKTAATPSTESISQRGAAPEGQCDLCWQPLNPNEPSQYQSWKYYLKLHPQCYAKMQQEGVDIQPREAHRVTAAEVLPFDPSKKKLKNPGPTRKGPLPMRYHLDPRGDFVEHDPMMQGDVSGDVEALFYFYDNIAGSLSDVRDQMVSAMQVATPEQKGELARLIRNIERSIQVLGQ